MPAELFRTVAARRRSTARRLGAVPLSVAFHAALLVALITIPLVANTYELPAPPMPTTVRLDPTPVIVVPHVPPPTGARRQLPVFDRQTVPTASPAGIGPEIAREPTAVIPELTPDQVVGSIGSAEELNVREMPPPPEPVKAREPIRVGGVAMPRKIHNVAPVYPPIAIATRVQGTVVIEAIISATGTVQDARVVHSVPLLDAAALDAVRQWVFTPTRLNDVPVAVILTVNVEFKLR